MPLQVRLIILKLLGILVDVVNDIELMVQT